jgi:predicted enzyme related to lactoylglutathione lyase
VGVLREEVVMTGVAPGAVAWFEIGTTDAEATEAFYGRLFGWRFDLDHGRIVGSGSTLPMGAVDVLADGDTDGSAISILAADVAAGVADVERLGGRTITPPSEAAGGAVVARVRDPLGNVVALVSGAEPAEAAPAPAASATPGTFTRFEIGSTDMDATRRFYERAFGWGFESTGDGYYYDIYCPDARDVSGGLWDQSSGGRDYATFSILTEAIAPTAGKARKLGARQLAAPNRNPDGVIATRLLDPAGAQFGLVALPAAPDDDGADDAATSPM